MRSRAWHRRRLAHREHPQHEEKTADDPAQKAQSRPRQRQEHALEYAAIELFHQPISPDAQRFSPQKVRQKHTSYQRDLHRMFSECLLDTRRFARPAIDSHFGSEQALELVAGTRAWD